MLKKMVSLTVLMSAVLGTGGALADDGICDQDDALANAAWDNGWCGDEGPAPRWADFEDTLTVPYEESVVIDENGEESFGFEDSAEMSYDAAADGAGMVTDGDPEELLSFGSCSILGDGSPNNPYRIICTNWGNADAMWYRVGFSYVAPSPPITNRILACRSTDGGATWTLDGWADAGNSTITVQQLYVYGSNTGADNLALVRNLDTTPAGTSCDYRNFPVPSQFASVLQMNGQGGADTAFGTDNRETSIQAEYVIGYGGNDVITLSNGGYPPTMTYYYAHGGTGNDTINGTSSTTQYDTIVGGEGNDTIAANTGNDDLYGYSGVDTIRGNAGHDTIHGGDGNDIIYGNNGIDHMYGGNNNDTLHGTSEETTASPDYLYGDAGDDVLLEETAETCDGGEGGEFSGDGCSCTPISAEVNCEY
jgi:hypothetical protein